MTLYKVRIHESKLITNKDINQSKGRAISYNRMLTVKIQGVVELEENHNFSTIRVKTSSGKTHQ